MNIFSRVFTSSTFAALVLILDSLLFKTVLPCSPNPNKPQRDVTALAILAPVVVVAKVVNISVNSKIQMFTQYSACLDVMEVIKNDSVLVPKSFCTKEFGTEAMCLSHVFPNTSYVIYLNTDLRARYDAHFSAARLATDVVIALARKGHCDVENSTNCVPPTMTEVPSRIIDADEGTSLAFKCSASGTQPYVVTWLFNGESSSMPMTSSVLYDGSLFLRKITSSCEGKYTCLVKNAAGSASHESKVNVKLKQCGGVVMVDKRLDIVTPNFPGVYPPDKSCVWRLCPPRYHRVKFHFNMFNLHRFDAIRIDNECEDTQEPWRKYCGTVSPGDFVSRCKNKCVQLRLMSDLKSQFTEPFIGMNVTVEPSRERRTKKFDFIKHYCDSDLVIKARFIVRNPWPMNSVKVYAFESFKQPFAKNSSYNIIYQNEDQYGCFYNFDFMKDYFYFATAEKDLFRITTAVAQDSGEAAYIRKKIRKHEDLDSLCKPPEPE